MSARRLKPSKLTQLLAFDQALKAVHGVSHLVGVDEVGRGSLVGPVVAAAVMIASPWTAAQQRDLADLDDSKAAHFTHEKRLLMAQHLKASCLWGIGEASQTEVETLNIARASLLAASRALANLTPPPDVLRASSQPLVVMDGRFVIPEVSWPQVALVKADQQSAAVAAASIVAKAARDTMMMTLAETYPGYGWETNMGYPTPAHQQALRQQGPTPLHRKTYRTVRQAIPVG